MNAMLHGRHRVSMLLSLPVLLLCACDGLSPTEPAGPDQTLAKCVASSTPALALTSVPPLGSGARVHGTAIFPNTPCDAENYRIALYVSFNGTGGICKPYEDRPLTEINDNGSWEASYATGGLDHTAPWIFALLVTKEFVSPCFTGSIPQVDGTTVLARVSRHRTQ